MEVGCTHKLDVGATTSTVGAASGYIRSLAFFKKKDSIWHLFKCLKQYAYVYLTGTSSGQLMYESFLLGATAKLA